MDLGVGGIMDKTRRREKETEGGRTRRKVGREKWKQKIKDSHESREKSNYKD